MTVISCKLIRNYDGTDSEWVRLIAVPRCGEVVNISFRLFRVEQVMHIHDKNHIELKVVEL